MAAQEGLEAAPGRDGETIGADILEPVRGQEPPQGVAAGREDVAGGAGMRRQPRPSHLGGGDRVEALARQRQRAAEIGRAEVAGEQAGVALVREAEAEQRVLARGPRLRRDPRCAAQQPRRDALREQEFEFGGEIGGRRYGFGIRPGKAGGDRDRKVSHLGEVEAGTFCDVSVEQHE